VIVRKLRVRNSRQISISKPTKERTIQHLLNVFVLKNVLNFAMPAKPESGCQKTLLNELLGIARRRRSRLESTGHQRETSEVSARENYCPLQLLKSCGIIKLSHLRPSSTAF
jgi:hypothetical protein